MLSQEEIQKLIELVDQNNISELKLENKDFKFTIRRGSSNGAAAVVNPVPVQQQRAAEPAPTLVKAPSEQESASLHYISAPLVGTFYTAASPDAPPFIKIGDRVQPGDVLGIIEAMKLMNEVESDVEGEVVQILVENANSVEYGTRIFAIRV